MIKSKNYSVIEEYPNNDVSELNYTFFRDTKFNKNRRLELLNDLNYLVSDLFDNKILKRIDVEIDEEAPRFEVIAVVDNVENLTKVKNNYSFRSCELDIADYLYELSTIILFGYDYYINVNICKEV